MGQPVRILMLCTGLALGGCTIATAVPGTLVEAAAMLFRGEETGIPLPLGPTLAAVQQGLGKLDYHADILELTENGYTVEFGEDKLDGKVILSRKTDRLTTIFVQARERIVRSASIEHAVLDAIRNAAVHMPETAGFNDTGYLRLYKKPDIAAAYAGLYRRGAKVSFMKVSMKPGWLQVSMPSGDKAYMRLPADRRISDAHRQHPA